METDTVKRKEKKAHHGQNVRRARTFFGKNQDELAILLNTTIKGIHILEQEETIDDKTLVQIANIFQLPIEFFKKVQPDDMVEKYVLENNTFSPSMTNSDTASNNNHNLNDYIANNQENNNTYNYSIDPKYSKLCEDLSKVHEKVIKLVTKDLNFEITKNKMLESDLARVQKELDKLKSGKNL
ncbi:helix-turn-helix domain-containing protein [Dysgonomonas sp. ZJ709]|uniref:helix-turn-helix domain-containing protein n=1 Tax=Dysgonomonas sp. ZJ709 TaxID=2709797 RepID=UPI0013EA4AAD|nr:helix-turn-helix transcriptional regulator [Dysgonomonas sp. ZJ709]